MAEQLEPIDASDPEVPVNINGHPFKVPLWQTDFDLADIVEKHRPREDGTAPSDPGAWLQDIKALLEKCGGPAAESISDGAAYTFYASFRQRSGAAAAALKKKLSETPS